ncbi:hypothetical protein HanXRQr2_Chr11g0493861 [Helianthus annuus]|uniref:Uncharacterized protein n=1 Tax=Helianthus annuus TaxID=4232 RepID=A0A9K3HPG8_HELAN|nr:hypothetical protein HanXRQr2_Chr11g0493861 [Helianthus annuus]KAJ0875385.1 hypothetical protein HanPSC8_Chr11g0475791 [Helianthus annuus]
MHFKRRDHQFLPLAISLKTCCLLLYYDGKKFESWGTLVTFMGLSSLKYIYGLGELFIII